MRIEEGDGNGIFCFTESNFIRIKIFQDFDQIDISLNDYEAKKLSKLLHKLSEEVDVKNSELPE